MTNSKILDLIANYSIILEKKIDELLPKDFQDSKLVESMRYSSLSSGKRIRPFLLANSAAIFNVPKLSSLNAAVAIEFIHTYSLIHDDLPAMDDDDLRRGQLTNHKKFGEATAILAGDALLTYAFEILSNPQTHKNAEIRCELISVLAKSSGFLGMVGGQMLDLENANNKLNKEQIANLHRQKTGELFMASCEMGAILGHASRQDRNHLRYYAHDIGLAFQIRDDILDHNEIASIKPEIKIDSIHHKKSEENSSIVDSIGMDKAHKQLELLKEQAIEHLRTFGDKATILVDLAKFITSRNH